MSRKLLLLMLFLLGPLSNANSFYDLAGPDSNGIIYVNKNVVGGTQSGNSWANAYKELADALKWADQNKALFSAVNPLQIWVAAGTYNPKYSPQDGTNRFTNKTRDNTFLLVDNVKVYGGFAGTETAFANRNWVTNVTILSGEIGSSTTISDNAYHVVVSAGTSQHAVLDGFSITGGNGNVSTTITINGKSCYRNYGGGIADLNAATTYSNLIIYRNEVLNNGGGGAISVSKSSSAIISNVIVHSNEAPWGAGIDISGSSPSISNSLIYNNQASSLGGGIEVNSNSSPVITNVTISKNKGGGIGFDAFVSSGKFVVNNCILYDNDAEIRFNATNAGSRLFKNTLIKGSAWASTWGTNNGGNIVTTTSPFTNGATDDFTLRLNSQAIDKGDNSLYDVALLGNSDLAANSRLVGIIDMGAYEKQCYVTLTSSQIDVLCEATATGEASVLPTTGTAPYTYLWNDVRAQSSSTATGLEAGTYTVTVTDKNGCTGKHEFTITTVPDAIKPTVITQDIAVSLDAAGNATITASDIDNGSADNCVIAAMTLDKTTFDCSNIGANTVTLTVTDASGNSHSAAAIVTVSETIKPSVITQDIAISLDVAGNAAITASDIDNGSADNCVIAAMTLDKTTFDCSNMGANTVTLTVTDASGNSHSAAAIVTVSETIKPTVITQDIAISLDAAGNATITAAQIDNGSADNCVIAAMTLDKTAFDCSNMGANTVTLTVTDASGNSHSAAAMVTIFSFYIPEITEVNQQFCAIDEPRISDIEIDYNSALWYASPTTTSPLSANTKLHSATYYVSIQLGGCYSNRVPVNIVIDDAPTPTGMAIQHFCLEKKPIVAELKTDQKDVVWYESATGGTPLDFQALLENNKKYYASHLGENCESALRFEVEVLLRYCDVKVNNGISANGDGKNDYLIVEGSTEFSDNTMEIFNSSGTLIYKTKQYGVNGNVFRGFSNNGYKSDGSLLPFGTYYYAFSYTNNEGKPITKTGFLHLNY